MEREAMAQRLSPTFSEAVRSAHLRTAGGRSMVLSSIRAPHPMTGILSVRTAQD